MNTVRLSKIEADAIIHRLEVPDCIADALEGDFDAEAISDAAETLLKRAESGSVWCDTVVEREVLIDSVEGSTWVACAYGDATPDEMRKIMRVAKSVEKKLERYLSRSISFPTR